VPLLQVVSGVGAAEQAETADGMWIAHVPVTGGLRDRLQENEAGRSVR
jgi:hypothetical protein